MNTIQQSVAQALPQERPARHPWYCAHCKAGVPSAHVTFSEEHDPRAGGCGCKVGDWPAATPMNEQRLFDIASEFGRRITVDAPLPGIPVTHKVDCVVMEPSELALFVVALGLVQVPKESFAPPVPARRLVDHYQQPSAQLEFKPAAEPSLTHNEIEQIAAACLEPDRYALFMHKVSAAQRKKESGA